MSGTIWIGTSGQHTNTVIAGVINGNGAGLTGLPSLSLVGQVAIGNLTNMMYWLTNTTPGYAPVKFLSVDANDALVWTNASASSFGSGEFVGNITNAANYTTNISGTNYFVNGTNTWATTYTNIYDGVTNIQTSSGISFGGTVSIPGLNIGQLVGVGAGNSLVSVTIGSGLQLVASVLSATGGGSFTLFFPTNNFQAGSVLTNNYAGSINLGGGGLTSSGNIIAQSIGSFGDIDSSGGGVFNGNGLGLTALNGSAVASQDCRIGISPSGQRNCYIWNRQA